ncbi:hypothetical protein CAGGBEG34_180108 [Candidatus Glomeribacter gigasporarum BEG34]|uniref:Uncharacterized protein n=1 Tax=Candidatus Glomeribacter gigasporarum BEG34 TaxID=1070319 RepID=G2J7Q4_9BURK|nr:hypothetical protein [Candidatus Glomeribacter gigasporarum]CCD28799.1 hypothetical protein CAGGBEG34_180108 [Candidatus Glomeribacter gigasporarum BEG34]
MIPAANSSIQIGSTNHHDTIDWFKQNILLALPYGHAVTQPSWLEALDSAAGYTVMLVGMWVCGYVGMWDGMKLGMPSDHMSHHGGWMDTVKSAAAMSVGESAGMIAYNLVRRGIGPAVYAAVSSLYRSVTAPYREAPEREPLLGNQRVMV